MISSDCPKGERRNEEDTKRTRRSQCRHRRKRRLWRELSQAHQCGGGNGFGSINAPPQQKPQTTSLPLSLDLHNKLGTCKESGIIGCRRRTEILSPLTTRKRHFDVFLFFYNLTPEQNRRFLQEERENR